MTIYLRDSQNRTIVDVELNAVKSKPEHINQNGHVELHSVVVIDTYTDFLLENLEHAQVLKGIFRDFQSLRGWLWEFYLPGCGDRPDANRADKYPDVLKEVRKIFAMHAERINDLCQAGVFVVED